MLAHLKCETLLSVGVYVSKVAGRVVFIVIIHGVIGAFTVQFSECWGKS